MDGIASKISGLLFLLLVAGRPVHASERGSEVFENLTKEVPCPELRETVVSVASLNLDRSDIERLSELLVDPKSRVGDMEGDTLIRSQLGIALGAACVTQTDPDLKRYCAERLRTALLSGSASYARGVVQGLIQLTGIEACTYLADVLRSQAVSDSAKTVVFESLREANRFCKVDFERELLVQSISAALRLEIFMYRNERKGNDLFELDRFSEFFGSPQCTPELRSKAVLYLAGHQSASPALALCLERQLAHAWTDAKAKSAAAQWLVRFSPSASALAKQVKAASCRDEISGS